MADLIVSKKSIKELFSELKNKKIIIPDYQRPYKWDIDKCRTLWEDIEHFFLPLLLLLFQLEFPFVSKYYLSILCYKKS